MVYKRSTIDYYKHFVLVIFPLSILKDAYTVPSHGMQNGKYIQSMLLLWLKADKKVDNVPHNDALALNENLEMKSLVPKCYKSILIHLSWNVFSLPRN